jgi:NTE family protein
MKALVLSGGASKGAYTAGIVHYLLREVGMKFDLAVGTSTGSLVAGPALLGDYNYLSNVYTSVRDSGVYKNSPFFQLLNMFVKIGPVGAKMEPLYNLLKRYYLDEGNLDRLIQANKELIVTVVNVHTGEIEYISSKSVHDTIRPETFIRAIVASCSEPVFTRPIKIFENEPDSPRRNDLYYDGGVKEFLPFEEAVNRGASELWAVSTHVAGNEPTGWGGTLEPGEVDILKALGWTINSTLNEVERGDLFRAHFYRWRERVINRIETALNDSNLMVDEAEKIKQLILSRFPERGKAIKRLYIIAPDTPMPTSLEFDPAVMAGYFVDGQVAAEKFVESGKPEFVDYNGWVID